jgi:NAD dependent epimerase/dehydratase
VTAERAARSHRGRRVLVTGADGFIGSHLVERLVADGAEVRALCMYNSNGSRGWLDELDQRVAREIEFVLADVRDAEAVQSAVGRCSVVIHLAALVGVPYSYRASRSVIETNVLGTHNVLQAARQEEVERLVHASTSEVYGTPRELPITEEHPLHGQSPYSASKIAADMLCEAWARSFQLPVTVLRPFNTFGPRQSPRAVIIAIAVQLLQGRDPIRVGSLLPRRDFTFVSDTVEGFLRAAAVDLLPGTVVQLGTGSAVSVSDVLDELRRIIGSEAQVVEDGQRVRPPRSEVDVLISDPSRAAELLGWRARTPFVEGLRTTVEWLRDHADRIDATRYYS